MPSDLESGAELRLVLGEPLESLGRRAHHTHTLLTNTIIRFWSNFAKEKIFIV